MFAKKYMPLFVLIALIAIVQAVTTALNQEYYLTQLTMSAYYTLVILGLTVLMGYTGQISIGHAAFFSIGGYTTAVLTSYNLANAPFNPLVKLVVGLNLSTVSTNAFGVQIQHLSPWASLIIAVTLTAAVAFIIGIPILKLKGHYLAMATLGFGIIVHRIVLGSRIFGEADGISDLPPLRSIHGNEEAANAMGVNTARYKLFVFVFSAVFASISGVFLTHFNGGIGPSESEVMKSVSYVAIVAVGGMANLWGALFMGVTLNYLSLRGYFGSYDEFIFGGILIGIMLFFPDGLLKMENFRALSGFAERLKNKFGTGG